MSVLTFQVGQCGNQVGQAFYDFITAEIINASPASQAIAGDTFFDYNPKTDKYEARSVLIDMEPKVINECLTSHKRENLWDYDPTMCLYKQEGSGNNWAFGHNVHGPSCIEPILEKFNRQLEKADFLDTVIFFQSLAGGTGSGFGSFLVEAVRENYPDIDILNIAVMPLLTGEVIVQNYNATMTLSTLYENSDAVLLVENDLLNILCKNLLHIKKPTLDDMNKVLATMLSSFLYPVLSDKKKNFYSVLQNRLNISDLIHDLLVQNPLYKLLSIKNVPQMPDTNKAFSANLWSSLETRLFQMAISNTTEANTNYSMKPTSQRAIKSIANLLIARGEPPQTKVMAANEKDYNFPLIKQKELYTTKISHSYMILKDNHNFNNNDKSLCLVSNSQTYLSALDVISKNVYKMVHAKAYLYQYEKHGLAIDDFHEALARVEQVYHNYSEL